jgi:hypothetical protein
VVKPRQLHVTGLRHQEQPGLRHCCITVRLPFCLYRNVGGRAHTKQQRGRRKGTQLQSWHLLLPHVKGIVLKRDLLVKEHADPGGTLI